MYDGNQVEAAPVSSALILGCRVVNVANLRLRSGSGNCFEYDLRYMLLACYSGFTLLISIQIALGDSIVSH